MNLVWYMRLLIEVIEYESPSGDYVKQYEGIPEDGVLAQSDKNAK